MFEIKNINNSLYIQPTPNPTRPDSVRCAHVCVWAYPMLARSSPTPPSIKLGCPLGPKFMSKEDVYKPPSFYKLTNVGLFKL